MSKHSKCSTAFLLILLTSTVLLITVGAQEDEIPEVPPIPSFPRIEPEEDEGGVVILAALGGTTDPPYGEYTYPNQTAFNIKATPNAGYRFSHWVISGEVLPGHGVALPSIIAPTDPETGEPVQIPPKFPSSIDLQIDSLVTSQNPLNVICGYGYIYEYQPVFVPITTSTPVAGVVVVLEAVGGSVTPVAGTYIYGSDSIVTLTATAASGFEFDHWIVSGGPLPGHGDIENGFVTDNPFTTHAVEGETYNYQPVFSPIGTTTEGGIPDVYFFAIIIVLVIIAVIGIGAALMYRGKSKSK